MDPLGQGIDFSSSGAALLFFAFLALMCSGSAILVL